MDRASLVLRLGLGIMFLAHGLQMAFGLFGGPGVAGFAKMLGHMGMIQPMAWAYLAALTTLIGGIFLIIGFGTRWATIPLTIFMGVALVKVHLSKGFFLMQGGYEYNFVILCSLLALFILGSGKYSINKNL
jgi:putative oxidoreductase